MPRCFVLNCGNYYSKTKTSEVMYHVFPNCKKLSYKWLALCRGKDSRGEPPRYARICSLHFSPACYKRDLQHELLGLPIRRKLKVGAVPDLNLPEFIDRNVKSNEKILKNDSKIKKVKLKKEDSNLILQEPNEKSNEIELETIKQITSLELNKKQNELKKLQELKTKINVIKPVESDPKIHGKPEAISDKQLPVRSSIRIAKRRSIEYISGPEQKIIKIDNCSQPKTPEEIFRDKLKFMSQISLQFGSTTEEDSMIDALIQKQIKKELKIKEISQTTVIVAPSTGENAAKFCLNRMHVMEDVEEGCDVSGALPSSPGHAEQRPDPPKPEISSPVESTVETEIKLAADVPVALENGVSTEDEGPLKKPIEEKEVLEKEEKSESVLIRKIEQPKQGKENEKENEVTKDIEKIQLDSKAKETLEIEETTNKSNEDVTKDSSKRDEEYSSGSESSRGSQTSCTSKRKRTDDEDSTAPTKKLRTQIQKQYANHDRILSDYIEASNLNTVEELQVHSEQLLAELRTLNELAREKEREWNNILHLKKVKEELLLRMQRKKQIMMMNTGDKNDIDWDMSIEQDGSTKSLMMVPVVSSSPSVTNRNSSRDANCKSEKIYNNNNSKTRNILPKHTTIADLNGQECRQGRQGPILDVRSIIADYRQRHPETVPRRGRRMKSVLNTNADGKSGSGSAGNVLSMASLALGSGSQMRHNSNDVSNELGFLLSTMDSMRQENSRSSNSDTSSMLSNEAAMSFKDVLVQFARLSQSERQELQAQALAATNKPPPPPYPEVTLHPVPSAQIPQTPIGGNGGSIAAAAAAAIVTPVVPNQNSSSLLHGILTKTQPRAENKPTTFSPTLARLLTAPERVSNNSAQAMYTAALNSGVSISDLLSTGKSRNEITITPVGQYGQNMKHKDGEHFEEEEAEDSADRLVIDEGNELASTDRNRTTDNGSEGGDDVPQCQGCHQKSAQFVCAGCGNQWYCSRDCQVAAWDEHSEVCSG